MKGLGGLVFLVVVLVGGYFLWMQLGGSVSGTAPSVGQPDVGLPDANEAGNKARDLGNRAADSVMGLSSNTWTMILIGLGATYITWLWYSKPKFKWAIIGGGIMLLLLIAVVPQL